MTPGSAGSLQVLCAGSCCGAQQPEGATALQKIMCACCPVATALAQALHEQHSLPVHAHQPVLTIFALCGGRHHADGHTTVPLCRNIRAYLEQEFLHKQGKSADAEGEAEEDGSGGSRLQQQQQSGEQQASLPQKWSQEHQGQRLRVTDKVSEDARTQILALATQLDGWVSSCCAHIWVLTGAYC